MKRAGKLFDTLISDDNLLRAIDEVNRTHHWNRGHKPPHPGVTAQDDAGNGFLLLRLHPGARAAPGEERHPALDEVRPQGDEVRVLRRHPPLLRQPDPGSRHGPDAAALQGLPRPRPHLAHHPGRRKAGDVHFPVVCQRRLTAPRPAHPGERPVQALRPVYGQPDRFRAEQAQAEKAPLAGRRMA